MRLRCSYQMILLATPLPSEAESWTLLLEWDVDLPTGEEVYRISYDSLAQFLSDNRAAEGLTGLGVSPGYSIAGLATDLEQFHLILESDADQPAGDEVLRLTYESIADFLLDIQAAAGFSDLDIGASQGLAGF